MDSIYKVRVLKEGKIKMNIKELLKEFKPTTPISIGTLQPCTFYGGGEYYSAQAKELLAYLNASEQDTSKIIVEEITHYKETVLIEVSGWDFSKSDAFETKEREHQRNTGHRLSDVKMTTSKYWD